MFLPQIDKELQITFCCHTCCFPSCRG
ncbi:hypothetical protein [Paenibacillus sp. Cedars]